MSTVKLNALACFRAISILFVCYLSGCSSHLLVASVFPAEKNIETKKESLESLYNVEIRKNSIWATVKSNGCTSEKSFKLQLIIIDEQHLGASIIRTKADFCRGMARIVSIELFNEQLLGNTRKVIIKNPLAAKPDFGRKKI
jgi:hypothetical protein